MSEIDEVQCLDAAPEQGRYLEYYELATRLRAEAGALGDTQ